MASPPDLAPSLALVLTLGAAALPSRAAEVPTPESVLGFRVGEDRKLADWTQIVDYFRKLDAASGRVLVEEIGKTTEGAPFLLVTITSEANMARLEEIRRANLRLWDPRGLGDGEAEGLVSSGRTIVALNHGIHSTEVAAPLTAMEIAAQLASTRDPNALEILDRTVVLLLPSQNPDGTQKVAEWYRKTLATPFEGTSPPFLYQKYTGHDDNRDWYMFTQAETRLTVAHLYDRWRPQIVHDLHQMGIRTARIFTPPYVEPWEPNVDPSLRSATSALGAEIAARLTSEGKAGVVIHALYDAWAPARAYPHTHGGVRILTECASARLASPVEVPFSELEPGIGFDPRQASWNFPLPWPGGAWRLRDIVDYQLSASWALLDHAARNREYWLRNFLAVNRRAASRGEPYAFVVPAEQKDPLSTARLLEVLRLGAVEVHRARAPFAAAGRSFAAGAYLVLMRQPASGFAKTLLERQTYPDLRRYPGGPPQPAYDAAAHTLPLLMGVEVVAAPAPFTAALVPAPEAPAPTGRIEGRGSALAFGHRSADLIALGRLLKSAVSVRWATEAFADAGRRFPAGTLLAPASARGLLETLARDLGVVAQAVDASPRALALRTPRVGLYQSWVPCADEGWTRFVLEKEAGVGYATLHDSDVRAGNLAARFDAILLPDQPPRQIVDGNAPGSLPPEYCGGLGPEGVRSLRAFALAGGTLVALNRASGLPIAELGIPVSNALADMRDAPDDAFYCPGSILRVAVDGKSALGHGLGETSIVWFESGPAFDVANGTVVARYVDENPLLSGWLVGGKRLLGKAALAEVPLGRGRVVLFGFRPQYRAQTWATYVALLNAIYTSAAVPSGGPAAKR